MSVLSVAPELGRSEKKIIVSMIPSALFCVSLLLINGIGFLNNRVNQYLGLSMSEMVFAVGLDLVLLAIVYFCLNLSAALYLHDKRDEWILGATATALAVVCSYLFDNWFLLSLWAIQGIVTPAIMKSLMQRWNIEF